MVNTGNQTEHRTYGILFSFLERKFSSTRRHLGDLSPKKRGEGREGDQKEEETGGETRPNPFPRPCRLFPDPGETDPGIKTKRARSLSNNPNVGLLDFPSSAGFPFPFCLRLCIIRFQQRVGGEGEGTAGRGGEHTPRAKKRGRRI